MIYFEPNILIISGFITAFVITYISIPSIIRVSTQKKLYDEPDHRSVHTTKTPTLGGVAIFAGLSISLLLFLPENHNFPINYFLVSVIILFFIGIKDDILIIAPWTKMGGQVIAALIITILGDIRITHLHGFFDIHEIHYLISVFLSVFTIIVIINAINFIDGVDGLSASIGIVASTVFGIWFYLVEEYTMTIVSVAAIGTLIAFLRFNLYSSINKIFMGDTGSLILGLLLSVLAIVFNEINIKQDFDFAVLPSPTVSFAILIIPLFDMLRVMFIRLITGNSLLKPDKRHIHHKLLEFGFSHKKIVLIIVLINIFFVIFAFYTAQYISIRRLLLLVILLAIIIFYIPTYFSDKKRKLNNNKK